MRLGVQNRVVIPPSLIEAKVKHARERHEVPLDASVRDALCPAGLLDLGEQLAVDLVEVLSN
jgi:hypothetical protein